MPQWDLVVFKQTLTISGDAYHAGDVVGGLITIPVKNPQNQQAKGFIDTVNLIDTDNVGGAFKLWLFTASPTAILDHAAFEPVAADMRSVIGAPIAISTYSTANSLKTAETVLSPIKVFQLTGAAASLYGYLVADATPNFTNADALTLQIPLWLM